MINQSNQNSNWKKNGNAGIVRKCTIKRKKKQKRGTLTGFFFKLEILLFSKNFVLSLFSLAIMGRSNLMKTGCFHYKNHPCPEEIGLSLLIHVYFFSHLLLFAALPLLARKKLKIKLEIWLRIGNFCMHANTLGQFQGIATIF